MKRLILVNGVPASGKSTVARAIARSTGWPLLTLDTVKEAFFAHLGTGDRDYNRMLGKASYQAMFALIGDWPEGATAIIDAWFGFQPMEVLQQHLARAGDCRAAEIWCHAPPDVIGERYRAQARGAAWRPSGRGLCAGAYRAGRNREADWAASRCIASIRRQRSMRPALMEWLGTAFAELISRRSNIWRRRPRRATG